MKTNRGKSRCVACSPEDHSLFSHSPFSKGVGTALGTILLIAIFVVFFAVYLYMANNNIQVRTQLNLESLGLLKLKSTFDLFDTSLGVTWFITTVQGVFLAADESIGCGRLDDTPYALPTTPLPAGYWYRLEPSDVRSFTSSDLASITDKYNSNIINKNNPAVCYPLDHHIEAYIRRVITEPQRRFLYLKKLEPKNVSDVSINIRRQPNDPDAVDATVGLVVSPNDVKSTFVQYIDMTFGSGSINNAQLKHDSIVKTSLQRMVAAGRNVIEAVMKIAEGTDGVQSGLSYYASNNKGAYELQAQNEIDNAIRQQSTAAGIPLNFIGTNVQPELAAGSILPTATSTSCLVPVNTVSGASCLALHYTATVTYTEEPKYYYHNTAKNKFEKKSVELQYKVEDYLTAIDCLRWSTLDQTVPYYFNWQGTNDMACCGSYLFECDIDVNVNIPNLPPDQRIPVGGQMQTQPQTCPGPNCAQYTCFSNIKRALQCTLGGFV